MAQAFRGCVANAALHWIQLLLFTALIVASLMPADTAGVPPASPPAPNFLNLAAELAALSNINPAQLAAQASANSRLSRASAPSNASAAGPHSVPLSPQIAQSLLEVKGAGYGAAIPPSPNLAGAVGRPTAAAAFVLGSADSQTGLPTPLAPAPERSTMRAPPPSRMGRRLLGGRAEL